MIGAAVTAISIERAVAAVRLRTDRTPEVGIVLGTGLSGLAGEVIDPVVMPYRDIPGFPLSTVETHTGDLVFGSLEGRRVAVMRGRTHRYEGYDLARVAFPVRVLRALGADHLVVSNVSGGMHPQWSPGDLVLLSDHINMLGDNPLVGPNVESQGPRFPDMSDAYDPDLRRVAREEAVRLGLILREGVYVAVSGPNLETAAEYGALRTLGADIVGMSTVPEVIVARQVGMRVLGLSIITDSCLPDALEPADIESIVAVASRAEPRLSGLLRAILSRI